MFALRTAVKQGIVEQGDDGAGTILLRTEEARDAHDDDAHDGQVERGSRTHARTCTRTRAQRPGP